MADVELSDKREITFDLYALTMAEYRALFDSNQDQANEDEIMARVSGLTIDEYRALPYMDWRVLTLAFFAAARRPLDRPNLESASTST